MLAALALFGVAIGGAKMLRNAVGVIPALFFFAVAAGLGYYYFRTGWVALRRGRENAKHL